LTGAIRPPASGARPAPAGPSGCAAPDRARGRGLAALGDRAPVGGHPAALWMRGADSAPGAFDDVALALARAVA
jgi:hypothetical protein